MRDRVSGANKASVFVPGNEQVLDPANRGQRPGRQPCAQSKNTGSASVDE
jgi:hypothetical protein